MIANWDKLTTTKIVKDVVNQLENEHLNFRQEE